MFNSLRLRGSVQRSGRLVAAVHLRPLCHLLLYVPLVGILYAVIGLPLSKLIGRSGMQGPVLRTIDDAMTAAIVVAATWIAQRFITHRDMATLGFTVGWSRREWSAGFALGAALMAAIFAVEASCGWIAVRGFAWQMRAPVQVAGALARGVIGTMAVAVTEETVMRGYVLQRLEEAFGIRAAVAISSSIFGVMHLANPTAAGWAHFVIPFSLACIGVMFSAGFLVRRSLWLPIGLHFAWNWCEYGVFGLTGAPARKATVLVTDVVGPAFWVGLPNSSFGPEAGMLGIAAALVGTGLLLTVYRRPVARLGIAWGKGGLYHLRSRDAQCH